MLAGAGAKPNIYDNRLDSPLLWAAYYGHLNIIHFLVEELGADVEHAYCDGRTALQWSARQDRLGCVEYLYFKTLDRARESNIGNTLYDELFTTGNSELLDELQRREIFEICLYYHTTKIRWGLEKQTIHLIQLFLRTFPPN